MRTVKIKGYLVVCGLLCIALAYRNCGSDLIVAALLAAVLILTLRAEK